MGGYRLDGRNPLAYMGVKPSQPPQLLVRNSSPTANDVYNIVIGTLWVVQEKINPVAQDPEIYMLVNQEQNQATWVQIYPGSGTGAVESLTGNSGGAVLPTAADPANINILGTGTITVVGNPGTNTLTVTPSGSIASSFITNPVTGTATPSSGVLTFAGSGATVVSAAGSIVTITSTDTGTTSFPTDSGTATPTAGAVNIKTGVSTQNCGSSVEFTGASNTVQLNVTDALSNTVIGKDAGNQTLTSTNTTAIGKNAGQALTSGASNTFVGYNSGSASTTGGNNTYIGSGSGSVTAGSSDNIMIGANAGTSANITVSNNTVIGYGGPSNVTGANYIAIGAGADLFIHNFPAGDGGNVFVGKNCGSENALQTNSMDNSGFGQAVLTALTSGYSNTCSGYQSGEDITTGNHNTCYGRDSALDLVTGTHNTLIGFSAGSNYIGAESSNIILGSTLGTTGESAITRIGNDGSTTATVTAKAWVYGIRGVTTDAADAIAVLISSTGQLGTVSSSIRFKDNVHDMGNESSPAMDLRPVTFEYKTHPGVKQYGLIAEEVAEHMPRLVVHDKDGNVESVKYHELPAILLNELQKLSKRVEELEKGCLCQK